MAASATGEPDLLVPQPSSNLRFATTGSRHQKCFNKLAGAVTMFGRQEVFEDFAQCAREVNCDK
jgi:hypothetical protein